MPRSSAQAVRRPFPIAESSLLMPLMMGSKVRAHSAPLSGQPWATPDSARRKGRRVPPSSRNASGER
eukprot:8571387-Pyramimonas_sp.AAC.1